MYINQKDLLERNTQVRLMGDTYKNAKYVLAWLDQPVDDSNRLHDAPRALSEASTWSKFDVEKLTSYQIAAFQWLFEHEYWQRQWIIQEIAVARSADLVSCAYQVPLSEFYAVLSKTYNYPGECYLNALQRIPSRYGVRSPAHLLQLSQKKTHTDTMMKELLYGYKDNQCSDPRDKVLALLSFCPGAQILLSVDYSVEPVALMLSVFDFCLFHEDLHTRFMISLGLLLRNQLQIATTTLDNCIRNSRFCTRLRATKPTLYTITALVCGHLTSTKINPRCEPCVLHCRKLLGEELPSLQSCCTNQLRELVGPDGKSHLHLRVSDLIPKPLFGNGPGIGIHELWAFEFRSPHSGSRSPLGLASTRVDLTDELWHFPKTPIALIARRDSSGSYSIVSRAYILRRHVPLG